MAITVSQLNRQVRRVLEGHFDFLWVEGELSNLAQPGSGHWYFTLKDDAAQVRCAMFGNRNQRVRFEPRHGQLLLVRARVSLYEGRGDFQLIVEHMEEAGAGALQRAFEELRQRLLEEGLFAEADKKTLPEFPRRIALLTSPDGAVIRDLITVFRRRYPAVELDILPVPVQGSGAAPAIAQALARADQYAYDALVLARGGGSLEDLWAFNEEAVARAIAACETPVVSAIGHETDVTIADFVADQRAPTPSAAAELLSPDRTELLLQFRGLESAMLRSLRQRLRLAGERLTGLRRQLRHPGEHLREQAQQLDDHEVRLHRAIRQKIDISRRRARLEQLRLLSQSPQGTLQELGLRLSHLAEKLVTRERDQRLSRKAELTALGARLDSLSPLATLQRGYAVVTDADDKLVTGAGQVSSGDTLRTRLAEGEILSQVVAAGEPQPRTIKEPHG